MSPRKTKLDVGLYKQGLEIMGISVNGNGKIKDLCLTLSPSLQEYQTVYYDEDVPEYLYNVKELLVAITDPDGCNSKEIQITKMKISYYYGDYGYFANNSSYYIAHLDLMADIQCDSGVISLKSSQRKKLKKKKSFNKEESESLISTVIYLAFYSAILDIQRQLKERNCT